MGLFNGMKLRARLILAFLMMSFVTATVGSIGYQNMRDINSMAAEMYQKDLLGLEAAAKARMNFLAVGRYLRAAMLSATEERKQQNLQSFRKSIDEVELAINEARPKFTSAEGQALISEFDRIWPTFIRVKQPKLKQCYVPNRYCNPMPLMLILSTICPPSFSLRWNKWAKL